MLRYLLPLLLLACNDRPPTTPETRPVDNPNAGNTAIYDVDPDDPYEMGDSSFLDMRPGSNIADFASLLEPFTLRSGDGEQAAHRIVGRKGEELGFLLTEDSTHISSIWITSPDVVTEDGLRVGNSFGELAERIGAVEVDGSAVEARVFVRAGGLAYQLAMHSQVGNIDQTTIYPATEITHIVIGY